MREGVKIILLVSSRDSYDGWGWILGDWRSGTLTSHERRVSLVCIGRGEKGWRPLGWEAETGVEFPSRRAT